MDVKEITEWTLDGVMDDIKNIDEAMKDRQFAFILGAGASASSGIPTGQQLAKKWLKDLHLRKCLDQRPIDEWIGTSGIGDGGLTFDNAAEYYTQIFEHRFEGDREAGYAELEVAMDGKAPSLGYSLLAEIIQHTRHKVVVTTNFDNLVADALAMHAHRSPLVVAHESLAGFVRPQMRRPLVAKIHRDLYLHPINHTAGVSTLEQGWKAALKKLFQHFTPIVVGYGGNDGSLMNMLLELEPGDISGRIIWCFRTGSRPPEKALNVLRKHNGILVEVPGFDQFMLRMAANLVTNFDVAAIAERTIKLGEIRAARYREQADQLYDSSSRGSADDRKTSEIIKKSMKPEGSWWVWQLKARNEPSIERRQKIYIEGLNNFPESADLHGSYGLFLEYDIKDFDAAEAEYNSALKLAPDDNEIISKYADFIAYRRNDTEKATKLYEDALSLNPDAARLYASYAKILWDVVKDNSKASAIFEKALQIDSNDYWVNCVYARFLGATGNLSLAEKFHKRSIELQPNSAWAMSTYGYFLENLKNKPEEAEIYYKKALTLDPNDEFLTDQYETFKKKRGKI
ncbi:tetratricopeptide repeat protein [Pseudomonas viridiflava]|uniref:tetratricopeptide repeat protein n=1 Tax=Pseudomonas viridiflava TaxID=33069 RepID=UPI002E9E4827|nr:tetratricopeptide repeat protein [Pseudomonas viridiflava]